MPKNCLKCVKSGQLTLRKITEILVTRYQIVRLKCTEFNFIVLYSALPLPDLHRSLLRDREEGKEKREGKGGDREGNRKEGEIV